MHKDYSLLYVCAKLILSVSKAFVYTSPSSSQALTTPLCVAAGAGQEQIVQTLLDYHAKVDIQEKVFYPIYMCGCLFCGL